MALRDGTSVKVLIVGSGAREHALAWKLKQSPHVSELFAAPGNAGTAQLGTNWPDASATDTHAIVARATAEGVGLAIIGPEGALAAGMADALRQANVPTFGPGRAGARLESSKAFAKQCMVRWGIPTARFAVAHDKKQALRQLGGFSDGVVIKADGLAAGKGVIVFGSADEARPTIEQWYDERKLPGGGSTLVLEERLEGSELSVMAVTDGTRLHVLAPACDYKRAGDGDTGPNTGGMGAYSPAASVDGAVLRRIHKEIIEPVRAGLAQGGIDYRGCIYAGLMLTKRGPYVLEFNARFGDPETEVVLPRLKSDLFELTYSIALADGKAATPEFSDAACVGVVLTSEGYPATSVPLRGLPLPAMEADVVAFWGNSQLAGSAVDSAGGRVLTVTALGVSVEVASSRAYAACESYLKTVGGERRLIHRTDIGRPRARGGGS
jgi:phosphoribosylamine---glycine ligase